MVTDHVPVPAAWRSVAWMVTGSMICKFVAATPATVTDEETAR